MKGRKAWVFCRNDTRIKKGRTYKPYSKITGSTRRVNFNNKNHYRKRLLGALDIRSALIRADGEVLCQVVIGGKVDGERTKPAPRGGRPPAEVVVAAEKVAGNQKRAAELLGVPYSTYRTWQTAVTTEGKYPVKISVEEWLLMYEGNSQLRPLVDFLRRGQEPHE